MRFHIKRTFALYLFVAEAAKCTDNFTVRFRENTLVVTSTQMEEARIYSMDGKLLLKERGKYVEFELVPGTYRLYAKVATFFVPNASRTSSAVIGVKRLCSITFGLK